MFSDAAKFLSYMDSHNTVTQGLALMCDMKDLEEIEDWNWDEFDDGKSEISEFCRRMRRPSLNLY